MTNPAAHAQGQPDWIQLAWAHDISFYVMPEALAVNTSAVYLVGRMVPYFGVSFDDKVVEHSIEEDSFAFIAKYLHSGELEWIRSGAFVRGDTQAMSAFDLGIYSSGDVLVGEGYVYLYDSGMVTNGIVHVVKYSPDGEVLMDLPIGEHKEKPADWPAFAKGLEVNPDGSFYVAGEVKGELVIGGDTVRTEPFFRDGSPSLDIFLARYDAEGNVEWFEHVHSDKTDYMVGLDPKGCFTTDRNGNAYICGQMPEGTVFAEGAEEEFRMPRDAWAVAKYDSSGSLEWVKWDGDGGLDVHIQHLYAGGIRRIAIDASGRLLTDWYLNDRGADTWARVGDVVVEDTLYGAEFLVAHEEDGSARLLTQFKSDGNEYVREMTTDPQDNIYISGGFDGWHLILGGKRLDKRAPPGVQGDKYDGFIAKLDSEGNPLWTNQFAGAGFDGVQTAAVSSSGDVYAAAYFETELYIEDRFIAEAIGWKDLILAKYSASTVTSIEEAPLPVEADGNGRFTIYPNPAAEYVVAEFTLETPSAVRIELYDALGRQVSVIVDGHFAPGRHKVEHTLSSLASGPYLLRGQFGDEIETTQLVVISP